MQSQCFSTGLWRLSSLRDLAKVEKSKPNSKYAVIAIWQQVNFGKNGKTLNNSNKWARMASDSEARDGMDCNANTRQISAKGLCTEINL